MTARLDRAGSATMQVVDAWRDLIVGHELELLGRLGVDWPLNGRRHIRCPFPDHEDRHPSWRWDAERAAWFCTCGGGDLISAVMRMRNCGFREAVRWVEHELGTHRRPAGTRRRR